MGTERYPKTIIKIQKNKILKPKQKQAQRNNTTFSKISIFVVWILTS